MKHTGVVERTVVVAVTCDRCKVCYDDPMEVQECVTINEVRAGYASIFGDRNLVALDLCQYCVRATLGPWLRVTSENDEPLKKPADVSWHEHVFAGDPYLEEEEEPRLDVIESNGSIFIWDPVTNARPFYFDTRERAIEFAKELVVKLK